MDLSAIVAAQDLVSFTLGLVIAAVPLYRFFEKNQLVPKQLQKEIQDIIGEAEKLENGYTLDEAQALGEMIIRAVAEYNEAAAKAAKK
jgi:membrane protein implicated in regulation of membrane protease activity